MLRALEAPPTWSHFILLMCLSRHVARLVPGPVRCFHNAVTAVVTVNGGGFFFHLRKQRIHLVQLKKIAHKPSRLLSKAAKPSQSLLVDSCRPSNATRLFPLITDVSTFSFFGLCVRVYQTPSTLDKLS